MPKWKTQTLIYEMTRERADKERQAFAGEKKKKRAEGASELSAA